MRLDPANQKPIFIQLAEALEDNILNGIYPEETQIPSTTEVAETMKINPATINRGVNLLVEEGIIYKKRGVGMFVSSGARQRVLRRRKHAFSQDFVLPLLEEAQSIGLTREAVIAMIQDTAYVASPERSDLDEHD